MKFNDLTLCGDTSENLFFKLFDLSIAPPLLYYFYIPIIFLCIFFLLFVLIKAKGNLLSQPLSILIIFFIVWIINEISQWIAVHNEIILFSWQIISTIQYVLMIGLFFISHTLLLKKTPNFATNFAILIFYLPIALLSPTNQNIAYYDVNLCEGIAGYLWDYIYVLQIITLAAIYILYRKSIHNSTDVVKKKNKQILLSTFPFVAIFLIANIISEYGFYEVNYLGTIAMLLFLSIISFTISQYKLLNIKLLGAQILIIGLIFLNFALLFIRKIEHIRFVVIATIIVSVIIGWLLVRSVKKVDQQREALEIANREQESLMHFITHQIKGYFTKSRNIFAMAKEGEYGPIPPELSPVIDEGFKSTTEGVQTVQDLLNASNLKKGTVAYNDSLINLVEPLNEVLKDSKFNADAKKLALNALIEEQNIPFKGDPIQLKNVFKNLIENAIHYTETGSISVTLKKVKGDVLFSVKDTGIGISPEDMKRLFTEGGRGSDSIKMNVNSTGYGLYIARKIVRNYSGEIRVKSEGQGKGSEFIVELPIK